MGSDKHIKKRTGIIFILFIIFSALLTCRLLYLQVLEKNHYTQIAEGQRLRPTVVDAQRGTIFDRNFQTLAVSIGAQAVYAIPSVIRNSAEVAVQLAPYLSLSEEQILSLLERDKNVWLDRKLSSESAREIAELHLPGIRLIERPQRFYPNDSLAAHVLGIAGVDNQGLEGLEFYYDDLLHGKHGYLKKEQDATSSHIPGGFEQFIPPKDGKDLVLTIDSVVQYLAERELEKAVEASRSERGLILIANPKTGEILANAIYPSFNPNNYQDYAAQARRNIAITDQYEPGSTFKAITGAAAVDLNITDFKREFYSAASWEVGGGTVHSWDGQSKGTQTFIETIENSDNITFAKLSVEMGPKSFYPYIREFGFGSRLGIDFPGETSGKVIAPGEIEYGETLQWANIGFGQGIAVTPLQLVMAIGAIANNGTLMKPYYVSQILEQSGEIISRTEPEVLNQVIREETANLMVESLRSAVVNGSGARADILGFQVAGKTGTAEVPEKGGYGDKRIPTFVGFAPADNPRVVALVALHSPQTDITFGGVLAAPVFHKVIDQTLDYLGVQRRRISTERTTMVTVPNVRNFHLEEAKEQLKNAGLRWNYQGQGELVIEQSPSPGSRVPPQTVVNLIFYNNQEKKKISVPNVVGQSIRDAASIINEQNLRIKITGSGMARKQSPEAGTLIPVDSIVEVTFSP